MPIARRSIVTSMLAAGVFAASNLSTPARATEASGIKVLQLLARKSGASHQDFVQYWRTTHAPMASTIPSLRGYIVQDVVSQPPVRTDIGALVVPVEIDGIAELWFDDRPALATAMQSPQGQAWLADKAKFVGATKGFVGQQDVIVKLAVPTPALKSNAFLVRKPGTSTEEFRREWHAVHGSMAGKVPYLGGFILFDVLAEAEDPLPQIDMAAVDGVAETYFASHEDQLKMIATPEAKEWFKDGSATFGQIKSWNTAATVIVTPPIA